MKNLFVPIHILQYILYKVLCMVYIISTIEQWFSIVCMYQLHTETNSLYVHIPIIYTTHTLCKCIYLHINMSITFLSLLIRIYSNNVDRPLTNKT